MPIYLASYGTFKKPLDTHKWYLHLSIYGTVYPILHELSSKHRESIRRLLLMACLILELCHVSSLQYVIGDGILTSRKPVTDMSNMYDAASSSILWSDEPAMLPSPADFLRRERTVNRFSARNLRPWSMVC